MQATTQDRPGAWVVPALVALALGATLWIVGGVVSGRKEPWDTGVYWTGVYPLSLPGIALARLAARWGRGR